MRHKLRKYQQSILVSTTKDSVLPLFWEMRLGKTLTTIRWLQNKQKKQVTNAFLIICPLSVIPVWEYELAKEGETKVTVIQGTPKQKAALLQSQSMWKIINYEGLQERTVRNFKYPTPLRDSLSLFNAVVLDESVRIKNPKAAVTRFITYWFQSTKYKVILSGLPNPESSLDFFCQMRFLYGSFMQESNYWNFRERYFRQIGFEWHPKTDTHRLMRRELRELSHKLTRKNIGKSIKKIRQVRWITLPPPLRKSYDKLERNYALDGFSTKYDLVLRQELQRFCGGVPLIEHKGYKIISRHKFKVLLELLEGDLQNESVVVFFKFSRELEFVSRYLNAMLAFNKQSIAVIDGSVKPSIRKQIIKRFRNKQMKILLCQTRCAQYGIDFSFCDTVIYYSNWDSYDIRAQSEDRILSVGEPSPCLYIDLICKDTVDEDIYESLNDKAVNAKTFTATLKEKTNARFTKKYNCN